MSNGGGRSGNSWQEKCRQRANAKLREEFESRRRGGYVATPPKRLTVWERLKGWFR